MLVGNEVSYETRAKTLKRNRVPKASPASLPEEGAPYENDRKKAFCIVGIGGSAGSLEAFEEFFRNMPAGCGPIEVEVI